MELLKLLGIVIVIAGFALKLDSILVILVAAVVTALVGGLGPVTLLETLGSTFVANRSMAIFIIVMLVTGTLERNGLREAAAALIGKFKGATSGLVIGICARSLQPSTWALAAWPVSCAPSSCPWPKVPLWHRAMSPMRSMSRS